MEWAELIPTAIAAFPFAGGVACLARFRKTRNRNWLVGVALLWLLAVAVLVFVVPLRLAVRFRYVM